MSIPAYNPKELHILFPQYCPCPNCDYYEDPDNYITKDGTYRVAGEVGRRQRLKCHFGGHRFSETRYSALFVHHGSFQEYEQTAKMTAYGMSAAQIADVLLRDERTVLGWQQALGKKCKTFHLSVCSLIGMVLTFLQMDEIWSYLKRKKQQLWVFITLEARTKFWVNFELGSRTSWTATRLLSGLVYLMPWGFGEFLLITTDKLAAYEQAITLCLEKVNYAYLQIVKQRRKRRLIKVKQRVVKGKKDDFPNLTQNTSYIERFNLTLRQHVSYQNTKNFRLL